MDLPPFLITLIFSNNANPFHMLVSLLVWSHLDYADFTSNCIDLSVIFIRFLLDSTAPSALENSQFIVLNPWFSQAQL